MNFSGTAIIKFATEEISHELSDWSFDIVIFVSESNIQANISVLSTERHLMEWIKFFPSNFFYSSSRQGQTSGHEHLDHIFFKAVKYDFTVLS